MRYYWSTAQDTKRITSNSFVINLRNISLGLYSAHNDVMIKGMKYELAESINHQNEQKFAKGMITETDALESEYNLLQAKAELDAAKRNRENALRNFNLFLCQDIDIDYADIKPESQFYTSLKDYAFYLERVPSVQKRKIKQARETAGTVLKMKKKNTWTDSL